MIDYKKYLQSNPVRPPATNDWWEGLIKKLHDDIMKSNDLSGFKSWKTIVKTMAVEDFRIEAQVEKFIANTEPLDEIDYIFEFGGGHGRACRMIHERGFKGKYTIFDFPEMGVLQRYYLEKHGIKVNHVTDMHDLPTPDSENNRFISMSAIEESPQEVFAHFLEFAKQFNSFWFKFSGGGPRIEKFSQEVSDKVQWEKYSLNPHVRGYAGKRKK